MASVWQLRATVWRGRAAVVTTKFGKEAGVGRGGQQKCVDEIIGMACSGLRGLALLGNVWIGVGHHW